MHYHLHSHQICVLIWTESISRCTFGELVGTGPKILTEVVFTCALQQIFLDIIKRKCTGKY